MREQFSTPVDDALRETTQFGTPEFPFDCYLHDLARHSCGFINWHWHPELQISRVVRGVVEFFVNSERLVLHEGEAVFVNSGALHMARPDPEAGGAYWCIDFLPVLLSQFPQSVFESRYVAPFLGSPSLEHVFLAPGTGWQSEILALVDGLAALSESRPFGWEYGVSSLLARIWLGLVRNGRREGRRAYGPRVQNVACVREIISYLVAHCSEKISLDALGEAVHRSPSECCRIFRKVTRTTIFGYLEDYRVERAAGLLRSTSLPVSRIADELGFSSANYFIRVFRRSTGQTPLAFRNASRGGKAEGDSGTDSP